MTPIFPSRFVGARTTPCATSASAEGVSVAMHAGHIVISIVRNDGSGMAVVLDDYAVDSFANHLADAVLALPEPTKPTLRLVK